MRSPPPGLLAAATQGFPQEFVAYFQYVRCLRFEEKPDYAYLRRLLRDLFAKEGEAAHGPRPAGGARGGGRVAGAEKGREGGGGQEGVLGARGCCGGGWGGGGRG